MLLWFSDHIEAIYNELIIEAHIHDI